MTNLLFVCTGNTCRSPMAEVIARNVAEVRGLDVASRSAGLMAGPGQPAAEYARRIASDRGLDLDAHRARPVTPESLAWADLVLGLTPRHVAALRPVAGGGHVELLSAYLPDGDAARRRGIADPFGGSRQDYEFAWAQIEQAVTSLFSFLDDAR